MLRIIKPRIEKNAVTSENGNEELLLSFVSDMERKAMETGDGKHIMVMKEDLMTLCAAAAMTYEAKNWHAKECALLERVCREFDHLPKDMCEDLKDWEAARCRDVMLEHQLYSKLNAKGIV